MEFLILLAIYVFVMGGGRLGMRHPRHGPKNPRW